MEMSNGLVPLEDIVDGYCIMTFNNDRKYYQNILYIAQQVWKDINTRVIPAPAVKRVEVDQTTLTARIPADCMLLRSVAVVDNCSNLQDLTYNGYKYVTPLPLKGCGCKECGCDSPLCNYVNNEIAVVTEDVLVNDEKFERTIKTKTCGNGDLMQEITEPFGVKSGDDTVVEFRTYNKVVLNLEAKPCGCIEPTKDNQDKVYNTCGCPVDCVKNADTPMVVTPNNYGHYKVENNTIYLFQVGAKHVIVHYLTNGEQCGKQIMVPEYCRPAVMAGIQHLWRQYRPNAAGYYDTRDARQQYAMAKAELYEFLHQITEKDFLSLQHITHKWG